MANDIDKTSPHYKGDFGSIYEVNKKFPTGGVAGDFVVIEGWAHYWNADRATWCVNADRDSYWDELITNIIEKFKLLRGATYMGVASLDTVPAKVIGAKMYYFATEAGTYKNFGDLAVPQGINVLYSENGSSWVNTTLLEVAQELGVSTKKVVSQKALNDALAKKFDKESVVQESGEAEDKAMSQKAVSDKLSDLSLKFLVVSLFDYSNVTIGKSINPSNGAISDVIKRYKLVKLHLSAGKYWIYSGCGSSSQATLWKYSDNGYASPEKEIVGSTGTTPYNQILTLEEGYYAFCWNDNNGNGISLGKAFITDSMSISALIDDKVENGTKDIKDSLTNVENMSFKPSIVSVFDKSDIIVGKYLNPTNKTISDAIKNYKLVKLHLSAKKYWLYIKNANSSQGILWKFTDETFSSVESEIIGAAPSSTISKILTLEEGYYAFCWNDGSNSINIGKAFITDSLSTQVLIDDSIKDIREPLNVIINTPIPTVMSLFSKNKDRKSVV